ncbi:MAG: nuclear transport factor 2 family protein [Cyclobacteriaceae bacterium]|jgi:hypothetical protein|nr:nuclear transport factor 2 family protein [Cyclobacteriaceae bacterium]
MKVLIYPVLVFLSAAALAQTPEEAVQQVVTNAYVQGIHNNGLVADIRAGFHPTFAMLRLSDNTVKPYTIDEWITAIEKNRAEGKTSSVRTEAKFVRVSVNGTAASVELELYREGKRIFTDYLQLYQFTEGWRIVSKSFYRHP